jgi:hypothetical protein
VAVDGLAKVERLGAEGEREREPSLMELSPSSSLPNVLVALPLDVRNACVFLGSPDSGWYTMDRRPALAGPPVARRHWLPGRPAN